MQQLSDLEPMHHEDDQPTLRGGEEDILHSAPGRAAKDLETRYDILDQLGRGGMGIVYKARDRETGEIVALKTLRPEVAHNPDLQERFKSELRLARKVTHKNVSRIYEFNRLGSTAFISMEYVEGTTLRTLLGHLVSLSYRSTLKFLDQICSGLAEAHRQGITHRDLKPENLMLDRNGNIRIMDFGIALSGEERSTARGLAGTPAYMAPEQVEGKGADARTDIYALGLILYEMFTGAPAFQADTAGDVASKQVREKPVPPRDMDPSIPDHMEKLILKCLEKDPKRRFQSVADLQAALAATARGRELTAARDLAGIDLPASLTAWQRSDWLLVAAMVAGLLLFFPTFNRTSLAPLMTLSYDLSVLPRIAREYADRAGLELGEVERVDIAPARLGLNGYEHLAAYFGAPAAREVMNRPVPATLGVVESVGARVTVDHRGRLVSITRANAGPAGWRGLAIEGQEDLAQNLVLKLFETDPSTLTPTTAPGDPGRYEWKIPAPEGIDHRYQIHLDGDRIIRATQSYGFSQDDYDTRFWRIAPYSILGLLIMGLGLIQRSTVEIGARWRIALAALGCATGSWSAWHMLAALDPAVRALFTIFIGLASGLGLLFASIPIERAFRRTWPEKLTTLVRCFQGSVWDQACGLALLRGTLLGLALLGLEFFLVWLATENLGARLSPLHHLLFLVALSRSALGVLMYGLMHVSFLMIALVFVPLLARRVRSRAALVAASGLLAALVFPPPVVTLAAVEPFGFNLLLLTIDAIILVFILLRYDILTAATALVTFAICWNNYSGLLIRQEVGNSQQWLLFAGLGVFVVLAVVATAQSRLRGLYGRLTASIN